MGHKKRVNWDEIIDSWSTRRPLPEHVDFQIVNAVHVGHEPGDTPPLEDGQPVPGCSCFKCTGVVKTKAPRPHRLDRLPVEAARHVPVLDLVERLGMVPARRVGKEYLVHCFMHEDNRPSLSLNATTGLWYCPVCAIGGDGIELWRRVRGLSFADAVREVAA